ncbi:DUF3795 domain-containing protein [candidate division KSB1 bacterium]
MDIQQIKIKSTKYGPCGLFCGACGAEDCNGCQSDKIDDSIRNCKFRMCAEDKNVDLCCYCEEYPCKDLKEFMTDQYPHHRTVESNLEYIRKKGVTKWLEAQQAEWSCKGCSGRFFWYQKQCDCGNELEAFEFPE